MNKASNKGISSSSLIDLKAELLRKQEQLKSDKELGNTSRSRSLHNKKKPDIWSKSNAGVEARSQKDYEARLEDEDALAKSRKILEAKTKAYERLASGKVIPDEATTERFLVDFEQKAMEKLIEAKHRREARQDAVNSASKKTFDDALNERLEKEKILEAEDPDEQWVDYVDSLGRSRRCLKKDLPAIKKMDANLAEMKRPSTSQSVAPPSGDGALPELMSTDMYREHLRQKWEEEEKRSLEQPETHYANVQHDEVREHGVAYYQFNQDVTERQKEMEKLKSLREQTKQSRDSQQRLKDKRKAMLASRLAKVRQRKAIREGKDPSEITTEIEDSDNSDEDSIGPKLEEKEPEADILKRDDSWRRSAPVREWDLGKEELPDFLAAKTVHTETSWKEKLREERLSEFAPPSLYQDSQTWRNLSQQTKSRSFATERKDKKVDTVNVNKLDVESVISNIRAEVETKQKLESSNVLDKFDLGSIPLPAQSVKHVESSSLSVGNTFSHQISPEAYLSPGGAGHMSACLGFQYPSPGGVTFDAQTIGGSIQYEQQSESVQQLYDSSIIIGENTTIQSKSVQQSYNSTGNSEEDTTPSQDILKSDIVKSAEPLPVHYSSGPSKPQPKQPKYERVNLHELPLELPAPPTEINIPVYPSQEEIFGVKKRPEQTVKRHLTEEQEIRQWKRQFDSSRKKDTKIPFSLPYVQSEKTEESDKMAAIFDPSKPPPSAQ